MALPELELSAVANIVLFLADTLGLAAGDVQYALSKSRSLGQRPLNTDDQIAIHMRALRQGFFGAPARGKPGTIVKIKAHGEVRHAYIVQWGRPTKVLYNTGEGHCADFEAVTPRTPAADFLPARLWLPYGIWTYPDGSEVVFSRDYLPLWRIAGNGVERLDPWLWMQGWVKERWFAKETETGWSRGQGRRMRWPICKCTAFSNCRGSPLRCNSCSIATSAVSEMPCAGCRGACATNPNCRRVRSFVASWRSNPVTR
jgi:hypothetical protein